CEELHPDICKPKVIPEHLKIQCIDCRTRRIITLQGTEVYYALSYVWGAPDPNSSPTQIHGNIKSLPLTGIPQVVEDSISVVQRLGSNYLWVDKYCIEQNETEEKQTQIDNMDKIYEGAYATIVAASGEDARSGLPGVSRARLLQPTELVGTRVFASTLPSLSLTLSTSKWMTRAWTYQEAILSRRSIYFTDHQVHFVCGSVACCE
ncbi:HET-domain-containing protein, partial [Cadophora sp. DSE1049]